MKGFVKGSWGDLGSEVPGFQGKIGARLKA